MPPSLDAYTESADERLAALNDRMVDRTRACGPSTFLGRRLRDLDDELI
jgi:hypothetical protein